MIGQPRPTRARTRPRWAPPLLEVEPYLDRWKVMLRQRSPRLWQNREIAMSVTIVGRSAI